MVAHSSNLNSQGRFEASLVLHSESQDSQSHAEGPCLRKQSFSKVPSDHLGNGFLLPLLSWALKEDYQHFSISPAS